nr:hypothetical protein [Tanacetum cinerariifolium]
MTSFGYRLNPRYAIKECLSCGALYTGDFCCSKGNVEDKILVPKLPKNCATCARCGHPVDGPYCQGCALLHKKLEEDLVTYFQDFQNTSESSNDSTNVVNAPREPFVVKKDHDAELLALRGQSRRARQEGGDVRVPNHHDAPRDTDSHI